MMDGDVTIRQAMNGFVVFQGSQHAVLVFHGLHELIPYLCKQFDYDFKAVMDAAAVYHNQLEAENDG